MAKKHVVEVVEAFEQRVEMGALVVGGKEIAPAEVKVFPHPIGERCTFDTKKAADAFCKFHGNKVRYVGKE